MKALEPIRRRRALIADALRTRLWPVPTLGVIAAIAAGVGTTHLDAATDDSLPPSLSTVLFGGGPDAAREVLGAVAGSLITVTSLTFSLTLVTLQLASSQFSPRLLRTFARDRFVQRTLALFLATFAYALTVLRTVRTGTDGGTDFVPEISVTLAYLLAVISVIGLVLFLAHLVREIRVETMLSNVYRDAVDTARAIVPEDDPDTTTDDTPPTPPTLAHLITAPSSGFLVRVDEQALLAAALEAGAVIAVDRVPGSSVIAGTPIAVTWPDNPGHPFDAEQVQELRRQVSDALRTGDERTPVQDVGYGVRQLTDVAVKALSPGINDPTTAIHALGHSAALVCELAGRDLSPKVLSDEHGHPRVVLARPALAALLDEAVSQPRRYGAADPAVLARLFQLLRELAWCTTRPDHRQAIANQLARLRRTVSQQSFDDHERGELDALGRAVETALDGTWDPNNPLI